MTYQNLDGNPCTQSHKKLRLSALSMAIASVTSMGAFAASEPQTTTMETVVVTGSLIGNSELEDVKEYPGARTVLTNEQIKKRVRFRLIQRFKVYRVLKFRMKRGQVFCLTSQFVV